MSDGSTVMAGWIEALRTLPADLVKEATPAVVDELAQDINSSISGARAPDGTAWQPKQDGGAALQNAGQHVTVEAVGTVILAKLTGVEARHHKGTARGGIRRQILPTRKIPDSVSRAISTVFSATFARLMGGA